MTATPPPISNGILTQSISVIFRSGVLFSGDTFFHGDIILLWQSHLLRQYHLLQQQHSPWRHLNRNGILSFCILSYCSILIFGILICGGILSFDVLSYSSILRFGILICSGILSFGILSSLFIYFPVSLSVIFLLILLQYDIGPPPQTSMYVRQILH